MYHVEELLGDKGYYIINIDATVIAQAPKLRPYIDGMVKNIADTLHLEEDQVNVKATTEEGLGFTGDGSGIAAQAVCSIDSPRAYVDYPAGGCASCPGCRVGNGDGS